MRLLVCGGRKYNDATRLYQVLNVIAENRRISHVAVIDNDTPFSSAVIAWAWESGLSRRVFPHSTDIENLFSQYIPDLVVTFPDAGNSATAALKAGVPVIQVPA